MNKNIYSFIVALTGILFAIFLPMGIYLVENYYVTQGLGEFFVMAYRGFLGFVFGVYIVSILQWVFSKKEKDFVPLFIILGAVAAGIISFSITSLITGFLGQFMYGNFPGREKSMTLWNWIYLIFQWLPRLVDLVLIFLGIRFVCKYEKEVPKNMRKRLIPASIGLVVIALPLFLSVRGFDFPANAPMNIRHEWAMKKFPWHYPAAVNFIKKSAPLASDLGEDIIVAPLAGLTAKNRVNAYMDGSTGVFTLEAKGLKGKGVCKVFSVESNGKEARIDNAQWEFGGKSVTLTTERALQDAELGKFDDEQLRYSLERAKEYKDGDILIRKARGKNGKIDRDKLNSLLREREDSAEKALTMKYTVLKEENDLQSLFGHLKEEVYNTCPAPSIKVIADMGESAVKPLIEFARETKEQETDWWRPVECNVSWAMEQIGTPAVEPLLGALKDENENIRAMAAKALGRIGDKRAIDALIETLHDSSGRVRANAAFSLGELKADRAVEPLIYTLKDRYAWTRSFAANALGEIQDRRAFEPLIACFNDENVRVRMNVIGAVGRLKDARAIEILINALSDEDIDVRKTAIHSLENFKDARVIEALINMLGDKDRDVVQDVRSSLQQITLEWSCYSQECWQEWWEKNKINFKQNK